MFEKILDFYENCSLEELTEHLESIGIDFISEDGLVNKYSFQQIKYSFGEADLKSSISYKSIDNKQKNLRIEYNQNLETNTDKTIYGKCYNKAV